MALSGVVYRRHGTVVAVNPDPDTFRAEFPTGAGAVIDSRGNLIVGDGKECPLSHHEILRLSGLRTREVLRLQLLDEPIVEILTDLDEIFAKVRDFDDRLLTVDMLDTYGVAGCTAEDRAALRERAGAHPVLRALYPDTAVVVNVQSLFLSGPEGNGILASDRGEPDLAPSPSF